jgi:GntR family transcriptional regulator, transcriptional repressor for pyruvate dehydrogenase complex
MVSETTGSVDTPKQTPRRRMPKLSETLARELFNDILSRRLAPGTMLPPEAAMLAQYGVGRASLREALRMLEIYGIIRVKPGPGGGPVVARVTSADFGRTASVFFQATGATHEQLIESRLILEPAMARLAAQRIDDVGRTTLPALIDRAQAVIDQESTDWGTLSAEFHAAVGLLSGNDVLRLFGSSLASLQHEQMRSVASPGDRKEVLRAHKRISDAIVSGNADAAERVMRSHLVAICQRQREIFPNALHDVICWL